MANGQLPIFKKEEQVQDSPSSTQEGLPIFSKESVEPQEQPSQPSEESGAKPSVEQELPIEAAEEPTVEPIDLASFKLPDLSTEDKTASQVRFEEEQKELEPIGKFLAEEEKLFPEIATRAVDETNREEYIKEATGIVESDKEKMKDIEGQFKILSGEDTTGKIELPAGVTPEQYVKDLQDQYVTLNRNILATTSAIYDAKSEKGTALGAIRNAAVNGYTNAVQGSVEFVFDALAMIDPAMAGAETREEALKNAREAAKNLAVKDTLDSQLKDEATTEEYLEKIKKGNILNEGLLGATESVFAMATPAMSGFFSMAYKGAMDEVADKDLSETEKRQYATTIGLMNLGLERFGISKAVKGAPGVTQQIAKALGNKVIKEAPKDVTEEVLQRAIAEEVKTFGDKFKRAADPTKFLNAFLVEAETGGLQTASEIGIQQAYNWAKEDEIFDIPDNVAEKIIRGAAAEGIGGVAFRGIGATVELVGSGKRNAIANLSTKEFDDLAQKIQDPKALQALKDNLQAQVNLDPSKAPLAEKTLSVVGEISSAFKSVPADTPNRKKVVDVMLDKQRLEKEAENAPDKTIYDKRIKKLDDQIGELIEAPEPIEEAAVPPTEIIEEQEYTQFVDEGVVSEERIQDIATKVTEQQELTPREREIFTDKTAEVNQKIEEIAAEEVVEPTITQDKFQEALDFIEPIASERRDLTVDEIGNVYEILGENASEVIDIAQKPDAVDLYNSLTDKKKEYAVQEQAAGKVPVQPEAKAGEKVEEGEPKAEPEVTTQEIEEVTEKIAPRVQTAPKNLKGLVDTMKSIFSLDKPKAEAAAVVGDKLVDTMSKRAGISKDEMYQKIAFQKTQMQDLPQGVKFQVDAWHGSPYQFDKFTAEKIGTGEGAQAFGWGLYFTDLESIARNYADKLSVQDASTEFLFNKEGEEFLRYDLTTNKDFKSKDEILESYLNELSWRKDFYETDAEYKAEIDNALDIWGERNSEVVEFKKTRNLYKVSIHKGKTPDQYTWLEWDKPVGRGNIIKLIDYISSINDSFKENYAKQYFNDIESGKYDSLNGKNFYEGLTKSALQKIGKRSQKDISIALLNAGIDGIKYPAESISRGATSDTAKGFNYVVFDENAVSIEEAIKFQKDAQKARGAMMMTMDNQAIIYALTDPNVSTPLHELAHVYEHYLTDAERKAILDWAGHKKWTTETSEKFARGFEKYLSEGKAPTPALQKYFDNFKNWLLEIYNGIVGSDIDIELNSKMRDIYDSMLVSKEVKLPSKTEEQRAIDRIVEGKISPAKKITMSEKAALKKQIQDFARGMREAAKDQRTFAKETNRLISENLQLFGDLTPSQVKALTRRAAKINFANPKSLEDFIDYSAKLEQKTEDQFYKDILKDVTKRTAPSKFVGRRLSGTLKGKIDNQARKAIKAVNDAVRTNNVELVDNAILNLTQAVELTDGQIAELEGLLIAKDLLSGDVAVAEEAQNKVKELITEGKSKYRDTIKARHEEYVRLKEESIDAITAGKGVTSIYGKLTQATKKQPLTDVIAEKLQGFLDYGEGLRTLLDKVDRTAERDESGYGGILDKEIYDPIAKGRKTKDALDSEKYEAIVGKLEELYGKDKKKILKENKKPQRLGTFTNAFGDEVQLDLSQNQAYPLYQYMQDANNMDAFRAMGFTDEMLQAVEDFLTPEIKEFADWQMNDFYPKYYEDINAVYKKMNDIDLPRQDNYVPISRDLAEVSVTSKEQEVNQSPLNQPQVVYGSLKQRKANKTPFDLSKDGNEKLMQYVEGMNQYIAFADPIKRMNVVFKDPKVREAVKQNNSIETLKAIDGFINRIANNTMSDGQTIALLDKIRGNTTIASLALAPTVTVKQLTSIPAYAADIPIKQFIKGLGAFGKNPMKAAETLMKSDYMQKRYKDGFERDMLQGMKRDYDDILKGTSNLKNKLMFLTKWGDKAAILMGGYSVYNYHYNKAKAEGKSNAMADKIALEKFEEATKLSQQSTNVEDLSQFQTMGSIGKLFTMYMTSPISYFRQERKSARDFVKGYKSGNKKLMRNAAKRFAVYHLILPTVFQYVANALPGLLTEWDEDDEKDLLRAATIGSFNGIYLAGSLISYFGDVITGKPWVRGGKYSPSPAFDAIVDIINEADDVIEEWNKNPGKFSDEFLEELIDFGTSIDIAIGYPVDRVRKLIDNWKMIANDNSLETREKIALGLNYSPYIVKPKKKKPTIKPAF